jgi:hypothetical protein
MILNIISLNQVKHCNNLNWDLKTVQRFWSKINIPDNFNDCWEWQSGKDKDGYGRFYLNSKSLLSHRAIYECYYENIPFNLLIRHNCDNPSCVNPRHLLLGTYQDNTDDMVFRNRSSFGERNGSSILTNKEVNEILKHLIENNYTQVQLSKLYDVVPSVISSISTGRTWKKIYSKLTEEQKRQIKLNSRLKLTNDKINDILEHLINNTYTQNELSKIYNVTPTTISYISTGKSWNKIYSKLTNIEKEKILYNNKHNKTSGEKNAQAKLTEKEVLKIRDIYSKNNISYNNLAKQFNIKHNTCYNIIKRNTWKHI